MNAQKLMWRNKVVPTRKSLPFKIYPDTSYSWCDTDISESKFCYIWTIKKFGNLQEATGECIISSTFSARSDHENKWCLGLYPRGSNEKHKDEVSLFLIHEPADESSEVRAAFKLSILDNKRHRTVVRKVDNHHFTKDKRVKGFRGYISRAYLMNKCMYKELLPNHALTVCCQVVIFTETENSDGRYNSVSVKDSGLHVLDSLQSLLESNDFSDVVLVGKDDKQLHAHKVILAARSPVFAAMFEHNMQEKKGNKVVISDIESSVLEEMLRYIYTGMTPTMDETMSMHLLAVAEKYALEDLKAMCERSLSINLTAEKVILLIPWANLHNAYYLKARLADFTKSRAKDDVLNFLWNDLTKVTS